MSLKIRTNYFKLDIDNSYCFNIEEKTCVCMAFTVINMNDKFEYKRTR